MITTYQIEGMTCDHCVRAVTQELSALDGVNDVHVDLASGTAVVASATPLDLGAVRGALGEADVTLAL